MGDWSERAACRDVDPELFFPLGEGDAFASQIRRASAVCRRCPSAEACLDYALETHQKDGIWGGLTPKERQSVRRRRLRKAIADAQPNPVTVREKHCRLCGVIQPASEFQRDGRSQDGLNASCRECTNQVARGRREAKRLAS